MEDEKLRKNHFNQLIDDINNLHKTIDLQKSRIKELEEALTIIASIKVLGNSTVNHPLIFAIKTAKNAL